MDAGVPPANWESVQVSVPGAPRMLTLMLPQLTLQPSGCNTVGPLGEAELPVNTGDPENLEGVTK